MRIVTLSRQDQKKRIVFLVLSFFAMTFSKKTLCLEYLKKGGECLHLIT